MRALGGVGLHLSGGVDSSSIVGMAAEMVRAGKISAKPLETFSLLFPYADCDERDYIREVVEFTGFEANYADPLTLDRAACVASVARYKDFVDYPNGAMWQNLWERARDRGFRVMISGTGSDEWMSGSMYIYADLLLELRWIELTRRIRADSKKYWVWAKKRNNAFTFFLRLAVWPLLPPWAQMALKRRAGRELFPGFIDPTFASRIGLGRRMRRKPRYPRGSNFSQRAVYDNYAYGWIAHGHDTNDRIVARFGLEERHPFLDRRLAEYIYAIPEDQRLRNRETKFVLRRAVAGRVPERILGRRDKAEFSIMFIKVFELAQAERLFDNMALEEKAGWLSAAAFRETFRKTVENYQTLNLWPIWTTFSLELWYRVIQLNRPAELLAGENEAPRALSASA
jgi:asparagine synthase (glutamine-hydrolysing)